MICKFVCTAEAPALYLLGYGEEPEDWPRLFVQTSLYQPAALALLDYLYRSQVSNYELGKVCLKTIISNCYN